MSPVEGVARGVRAVWRGHAPNCSSSGSVVGLALLSTVATAAIVNAWAHHFLRWARGGGGPPPRLRREADGSGLLALDEGGRTALLHVEPPLAERAHALGASPLGRAAPPAIAGALSAPTEVHVAVTDRCPVRCTGCYLDAGPGRAVTEPGAATLKAELQTLADMGVVEVAFGGGESLLRADLLDLAEHARALGLVPNLTTSGFGLSRPTARRLAQVMGQVNVSLDGLGSVYAAARGWSGAERGLAAVRTLVDAGARVGVNTLLTRPLLLDRRLEELGDAVGAAGASEWQWLRFKPAGRGAESYADLAPDAEAAQRLWPRALALEAATGLILRFDCALVPFLVAHRPPLALVQRLGVRGCPGGHSLWARSASGGWAPCSFVPGAPAADLDAAWADQRTLTAWRQRALAPPDPCASCDYASVCRGGCRVVSQHLAGDAMAPDPECPRVRARGRCL